MLRMLQIISNPATEKICVTAPVYLKHNIVFLVDPSTIIAWRDISFYFDNEKENHAVNASEDDATHIAKRYTSKHKCYPDFYKIVISLSENGSCSPLNFV